MGTMQEYEGSPELDVDLELLSVYEKRLERAIRCEHFSPQDAQTTSYLLLMQCHGIRVEV
jgi:hypothetical protein